MKSVKYIVSICLIALLTSCASNENVSKSSSEQEPDLIQGSKLNLQLGTGYMKRGQYKIAKEKLEKAIEQDPKNIEAYSTLALLLNKLKENDKAEEYYLQAMEIDGNNSWLHNSYGAFLCGIDRVDDALAAFKVAYTDPFYDTAYIAKSNAGSCLVKHGEYKRAEPLLRGALKINPRLSGALFSMAELGVETKKFLMARAYIQRFHDLNKSSAESLWIQVQAEKGLKAEKHYLKYAKKLLKDFPNSPEAKKLEKQARKNNRN